MAVRLAMVKPSRRRQSLALVIISGTINSQKKRKLHAIKKHDCFNNFNFECLFQEVVMLIICTKSSIILI